MFHKKCQVSEINNFFKFVRVNINTGVVKVNIYFWVSLVISYTKKKEKKK